MSPMVYIDALNEELAASRRENERLKQRIEKVVEILDRAIPFIRYGKVDFVSDIAGNEDFRNDVLKAANFAIHAETKGGE